MLTARYRQSALDKRRYIIDISNWLADGETITALAVTVDDGLTVDTAAVIPPALSSYQFYASGGEAGRTYSIHFVATTSEAQERHDRVDIIVEGAP